MSYRYGTLKGHRAGNSPKLAPGIYGKPSDKAWTIELDDDPVDDPFGEGKDRSKDQSKDKKRW